MITEFEGQNGKILVHDDHLVISKDTSGGFISQGGSSGERKIYYKDIASFEYKKPTFIANGYYKVIIPGTKETNAKVGILGSSMDSMKDQNTIVLRTFIKSVGEETERIYRIIEDKIAEAKKDKTSNMALPQSTRLDELKKLGELLTLGILSNEEFQKEKEKILSSN